MLTEFAKTIIGTLNNKYNYLEYVEKCEESNVECLIFPAYASIVEPPIVLGKQASCCGGGQVK